MLLEGLLGVFCQFLPERRMGNGDHGLCPFLEGQAGEICDAVFCCHILDEGAGSGNHAATGDKGHDVALEIALLILAGRVEADEALAALGAVGAPPKSPAGRRCWKADVCPQTQRSPDP